MSSAGNTRGLIEACSSAMFIASSTRLPRGIPAASLKQAVACRLRVYAQSSAGNTRGLIEAGRRQSLTGSAGSSSAGNTRGLIEATRPASSRAVVESSSAGNTRGLIEAVLASSRSVCPASCLPRGIPAASLKRSVQRQISSPLPSSSAGNTRGLIEARSARRVDGAPRGSSAGNTRGLIEAEERRSGWESRFRGLPRGIPAVLASSRK